MGYITGKTCFGYLFGKHLRTNGNRSLVKAICEAPRLKRNYRRQGIVAKKEK